LAIDMQVIVSNNAATNTNAAIYITDRNGGNPVQVAGMDTSNSTGRSITQFTVPPACSIYWTGTGTVTINQLLTPDLAHTLLPEGNP
jgi:hypothetical protein